MSRRVVFDSNTWRKVSSPHKFQKDAEGPLYQKLHELCAAGDISALLSETTFTLEQIRREERLDWIKSGSQIATTGETGIPGILGISLVLAPSTTVIPGNYQMVEDHLKDALGIGFLILRSNRISGPRSPMLKEQMFLGYSSDEDFHEVNNMSAGISRDLEKLGVGIANIKSFGNTLTSEIVGTHWTDGIASLSGTKEEKNRVAEMVAEWADSDALATSIAHGAEFFCTNDLAAGASKKGVRSIMLPENVVAISKKFGVKFVTPKQLLCEFMHHSEANSQQPGQPQSRVAPTI